MAVLVAFVWNYQLQRVFVYRDLHFRDFLKQRFDTNRYRDEL